MHTDDAVRTMSEAMYDFSRTAIERHADALRSHRLGDMLSSLLDARRGYPGQKVRRLDRVGDHFGNDNTRIYIEEAEAPAWKIAFSGEAWTGTVVHHNEGTFYVATSCESMSAAINAAIALAIDAAMISSQAMLAEVPVAA